MTVKVNDIVQVTGGRPEFLNMLFVVEEVKSWGVQAYSQSPEGRIYVRVTNSQFVPTGGKIQTDFVKEV